MQKGDKIRKGQMDKNIQVIQICNIIQLCNMCHIWHTGAFILPSMCLESLDLEHVPYIYFEFDPWPCMDYIYTYIVRMNLLKAKGHHIEFAVYHNTSPPFWPFLLHKSHSSTSVCCPPCLGANICALRSQQKLFSLYLPR